MNISEFAKEAGVSISAVSRYFNNGYLSDDKREKIEKAVEKTGYSPSVSAQTMRTRVTKLVGVILPKLTSDSCARVTEGISHVLNEQGYQILLVNTANDYHKEVEYLELFRQNRVDGVILLASIFTDLHKSVLKKMHIPVIIVGQEYEGLSCVCHDDFGAAYALTELMLKKGAKQPAYIGVTDEDRTAGLARHRGFIEALRNNGADILPRHEKCADFSMESGRDQAKRILASKPYPDCIFCATDNIAAGAMIMCREKGLNVPEDIMICGIGDSKIDILTDVSITSAHLHYKTAGIEAAEMLLSALRRKDSIPRTMKLGYEIIERKSTQKN